MLRMIVMTLLALAASAAAQAQIVVNEQYAEHEPIVATTNVQADALKWSLPDDVATADLIGDGEPLKQPQLPLWAKAGTHTIGLIWVKVTPDENEPSGHKVDLDIDQKTFKVIGAGPPNQPPTASAGPDQAITLAGERAEFTLAGSGADSDGQVVAFKWSQTTGPAVMLIMDGSTALVNDAGEGEYEFRLTVTDDDGATGTDDVKVVVSKHPQPPPPSPIPDDQFENLGQRVAQWTETLVDAGYKQYAKPLAEKHKSVAKRLKAGELLTISQAAAALKMDIRKDVLDTQEKQDAWAKVNIRIGDAWDMYWPTMDKQKCVDFYNAIAAGLEGANITAIYLKIHRDGDELIAPLWYVEDDVIKLPSQFVQDNLIFYAN